MHVCMHAQVCAQVCARVCARVRAYVGVCASVGGACVGRCACGGVGVRLAGWCVVSACQQSRVLDLRRRLSLL